MEQCLKDYGQSHSYHKQGRKRPHAFRGYGTGACQQPKIEHQNEQAADKPHFLDYDRIDIVCEGEGQTRRLTRIAGHNAEHSTMSLRHISEHLLAVIARHRLLVFGSSADEVAYTVGPDAYTRSGFCLLTESRDLLCLLATSALAQMLHADVSAETQSVDRENHHEFLELHTADDHH